MSYGGGAPPWVYKNQMSSMQSSYDHQVRLLNERIKELEEENKKLKEENHTLTEKIKELQSKTSE